MHRNLIGGEWVHSSRAVENRSPSDLDDVIGEFAQAERQDLDTAIAVAIDSQRSWADLPPANRGQILDEIGREIQARAESIGKVLAREEGKTLFEARMEVQRAGDVFRYFGAEALRTNGISAQSLVPGVRTETRHVPVGVIGIITPWNFPASIPAWKAAPALAFGNAVILKPSNDAPAAAWAIAEIIAASQLPKGVFNLVMGSGHEIGQRLLTSSGIDAISFTGSGAIGETVIQQSACSGKKVQAELGGSNPLIVMDDADMATALECAMTGAFMSTGQRCTAFSRIIVHERIFEEFASKLVDAARTYRVGNALSADTQMGPVATKSQFNEDLAQIEAACAAGATALLRGEALSLATEGFYLTPSIFTDVTSEMSLWREEVFGPVVAIRRAASFEEAIALANDTQYGLTAGIVTTSLRHAETFKSQSQAGVNLINVPPIVDYHVPFGGAKGSGYGSKEMGRAAFEFFTESKTAYTRA